MRKMVKVTIVALAEQSEDVGDMFCSVCRDDSDTFPIMFPNASLNMVFSHRSRCELTEFNGGG